MWDCCGVLQIDGTEWTTFNADNSAVPRQNIWSIASHTDGHVWIGLGFVDPICRDRASLDLMRFDGMDWMAADAPADGTVRRLKSVGGTLVALVQRDGESTGFLLGAFDGQSWTTLQDLTARSRISRIEVDERNKELWLALEHEVDGRWRTTMLRDDF